MDGDSVLLSGWWFFAEWKRIEMSQSAHTSVTEYSTIDGLATN